MKRGTSVAWGSDYRDVPVLTISNKRGKLTLSEIQDILLYEEGQKFSGHYAILLNCSEATVGGNGLWDAEDDQGDAVDLYPIDEYERCPVCANSVPPYEYCPNCGAAWKDIDKNVETLLEDMKQEAVRMVETAESTASKAAWYWTHIGALDMARQLGLITDKRRQELCHKIEYLKERFNDGKYEKAHS